MTDGPVATRHDAHRSRHRRMHRSPGIEVTRFGSHGDCTAKPSDSSSQKRGGRSRRVVSRLRIFRLSTILGKSENSRIEPDRARHSQVPWRWGLWRGWTVFFPTAQPCHSHAMAVLISYALAPVVSGSSSPWANCGAGCELLILGAAAAARRTQDDARELAATLPTDIQRAREQGVIAESADVLH